MRRVLVAALLGLAAEVVAPAWGEAADAGAPRVALTCERADSPGRVRCDVEARVEGDASISWGDVVILRTPAFLVPLRGRVGPHDATVRDRDLWRWPFALLARTKGSGDVDARVRLVVCRAAACEPTELDVTGRVVAGD